MGKLGAILEWQSRLYAFGEGCETDGTLRFFMGAKFTLGFSTIRSRGQLHVEVFFCANQGKTNCNSDLAEAFFYDLSA
jgi:hypothetical protein